MHHEKHSRWPEWLLLGYGITLITATHWPKLPGVDIPGKDKTAHFLAYGILAGLILNVIIRRQPDRKKPLIVLLALSAVGIFGALDERTQPYFGRTCDIYDWLADLTGAALASLGFSALLRVRSRRSRNTDLLCSTRSATESRQQNEDRP